MGSRSAGHNVEDLFSDLNSGPCLGLAVDAPRCGVSTVFGAPSKGESRGGSCSKTSTAAPPSWPLASASASAASSTMPPRATLTSSAVGFISASAWRRSCRASPQSSGTWSVTTSARPSSSSSSTSSTPCAAAASALGERIVGDAATISIARARSATASPILPRPMMPSVFAAKLLAHEVSAAPLAAAHRGVGGSDVARQRVASAPACARRQRWCWPSGR